MLFRCPECRTLELSPADRERTPPQFAKFLLSIAARAVTPIDRSPVTPGQVRGAVTPAGSYTDLAKRAAEKRAAFKQWAGA